MKLNKSFIFRDIKNSLIDTFGKDKADLILKEAQNKLDEFEINYPNLDKKESVFPAASIYIAIEKYEPNKALTFIRDYGNKIGIKAGKILKSITSIPGVSNLLWKKMDKIAQIMSSGYKCDDVIVSEHELKMDVIGCPLYDGAKQLNVPEAAQLFCAMDQVYMKQTKGVKYQRTKSIAEGDECCDYLLQDSRDNYKN